MFVCSSRLLLGVWCLCSNRWLCCRLRRLLALSAFLALTKHRSTTLHYPYSHMVALSMCNQYSAHVASEVARSKQWIKILTCSQIFYSCLISRKWSLFFLLTLKYCVNVSCITVTHTLVYMGIVLFINSDSDHFNVLSTERCRTWRTGTGRRNFLEDSSWHRTYSTSLLWSSLVRLLLFIRSTE